MRDVMAFVVIVLASLAIGFISGARLGLPIDRPAEAAPPALALVERVSALEARAEEQAKARCFSVKTDRLDVAIFHSENLGKAKVNP
jgi:hypothetical protein